MLWVGLTGGIASGKSTVAGFFESLGVTVVYADRLAHDVLASGTEGARRVREEFGDIVVAEDGSIDRTKLGQLVFSDKSNAKRLALEAIVHPEVRGKSESERRRLKARGDAVAVYEIPLLFEKNLEASFDLIMTVSMDAQTQADRLMKRSNLTREQAYARVAAQLPQEQKVAKSDFVIWNNGDETELRRQTEQILKSILKNP